jgi:peptidyl-prolyl cis-trans isomerase-like 2
VKSKQLKGYVILITSEGPLKCEIECNLVPKAAENFIELCENGSYNKTAFHRIIAGFMAQGGDTDGKGGVSFFHPDLPFKDEFHEKLSHDSKGVLAMANSGKDTNKSQFYVTFKECPHLDNKHTVFGRITADSHSTLSKIEKSSKVEILETKVVSNPFREAITGLLRKEW